MNTLFAFFSAPFFPALGSWLGTALVGAGLASAPVIIHLLNKRRFRKREWAAVRFLMAALKKNARRLRLEQLLLLAVRILIVLLLVAAVAKPYLKYAGISIRSGVRDHKVIVLDGSYSMAYQPGQRSRFDRAKDVARRIVEESKKGDAVSVILLAAPPRLVIGQPSYDLDEVLQEISVLELTHGGADLPAALAQVEQLLQRGSESLKNKEVYFLTDLQRAAWLPDDVSALDREEFRKRARRIDEKATMVVIDVGQDDNPNVALTNLRVRDPYVTVGNPAMITAMVENFGRQPVGDLAVQLYVDGQVEDDQRVDIEAGAATSVTFSPVFSADGEYAIELRVAADALPLDDRRFLALPVDQLLGVLCVNGKPAGEYFEQATAYLQTALAPRSAAAAGISSVEPVVVSESQWWNHDLRQYACVFFCNVGQFTQGEYERIRDYVERGGAVVWFLGDQVRSEAYNRVLYRDGAGVLPVQLGAHVGNAEQKSETFLFDPLGYEHPIVAPFRDALDAGLVTTAVYQYIRAEVPAGGRARVAMAFQRGDPAIVEQQLGRGKAIVVTTSADRSWTTWPIWYSYVPIVHELLRYAVADRLSERAGVVGRPVGFAIAGMENTAVAVQRPDNRADPLQTDAGGALHYPQVHGENQTGSTELSGIYRVYAADRGARASSAGAGEETPTDALLGRETLFAINLDTSESDLAKLDRAALRDEVWPGVDFAYNPQNPDEGPVRHGGELHRLFIYALLGMLFLELFLAWKFGHYTS